MKTNFDVMLALYMVCSLMFIIKGLLIGVRKKALIENSKFEIFMELFCFLTISISILEPILVDNLGNLYLINVQTVLCISIYCVLAIFYLRNKIYVTLYGVSKKIILEEISKILEEKEIQFTLLDKGIIKEVKKIYINEKDSCIKITDDEGIKYCNKIRFINFKDEELLKEIKKKLDELWKINVKKTEMASGIFDLAFGIFLLTMTILGIILK